MGTEFVGPFANHPNLDTDYGAVGNSTGPGNGADDTAAIQAALDDLGNTGVHNIWGPTGGYRVTEPLTLSDRQYVSLLMEDPADTKLIWDGAENSTMLNVNGVAYSRLFHRCTLQANGGGIVAIDQARLGPSTGNFDTGNEYADMVFEDFDVCINGGRFGYGFAETSVLRCKFVRANKVACFLWNFNALNLWLRYCEFIDCQNGVANYLPEFSMEGAGGWREYRCIFRDTVNYDNKISATSNFSFRECYSIGAKKFISRAGGSSACNVTVQGCKILDTKDSCSIDLGSVGPSHLYDNVIRSKAEFTVGAAIEVGSDYNTSDNIAIDNTGTVDTLIYPHSQGAGRLFEVGSTEVTRASIDDSVPFDMPTIPQPRSARTVFEVVSGGSVAAAVASAVAVDGLVHLQEGNHVAVDIPDDSDIQVVGDGFVTKVLGNSLLNGPLKFTLTDICLDGGGIVDSLKARNIDQVGSRVFFGQCQFRSGVQGNLLVNGLDHTLVELEDCGYLGSTPFGIKVVGGPLAAAGNPANGRVNVYSGLCANISGYAHDARPGAKLLIRDTWYEESITTMLAALITSGRVTVTYEGSKSYQASGKFAIIDGLVGKVSLLNNIAARDTLISGDSSGGKVLGAGFVMMSDYLPAHDYFVNSGSADAKLLNSREWTEVVPLNDTAPTANEGTVIDAFLVEMFAQTRAESPGPLEDLAAGVSDIRFERIWATNGTNSINLAGQERTGFRLHFG